MRDQRKPRKSEGDGAGVPDGGASHGGEPVAGAEGPGCASGHTRRGGTAIWSIYILALLMAVPAVLLLHVHAGIVAGGRLAGLLRPPPGVLSPGPLGFGQHGELVVAPPPPPPPANPHAPPRIER